MNKRLVLLLALAAVLVVVGISAGGAFLDDESDEAVPASTETLPEEEQPLSTEPTPPAVKTQVYERALSECSTTSLASLKGKYRVAQDTIDQVSLAVAIGWARTFGAGQDAVDGGQQGCLDGFAYQAKNPTTTTSEG